ARGEAAPGQGIPTEGFSIRWSGQLLPPVSGRDRIEAAADDGYRLYVDGKRVLDHGTSSDRLPGDGVDLDREAGRA
ncbi:PA14 domain-containing protein, partial [Stenotrophomonas sp. SrG]|uniref:PA14 domain-containing protein n=1 Tax=Stenotrophomonas sp. SrG TaxID=3414430 RepID=UPI003CF9D301